MTPFATVEDYADRYGPVPEADEGRVATLLADASNLVASQPGFEEREGDETFSGVLESVTCAMVYRSMRSGAYAGLSSVSQGAGGYTASVGVYNPGGDLFLTDNERRALGLEGGRVGMSDPWGGSEP